MTLKKEIARANIIFTAGRFISIVISFFFSIILARMLQPYNFGLYNFCLMVAGFFVVFADFGLNSTLIRFVANYTGKSDKKSVNFLVGWVIKYKLAMTMAVGALVSIFSGQISGMIFGKPEAAFVVFFSGFVLIFLSFFEFFKSLFLGMKNFEVSGTLPVLENLVKFGVVISFVLVGMSISGVISGLIISYIILNAACIFILYKKCGFLFSGEKKKIESKLLKDFSFWIMIGSVVNTVYGFADQLVISALLPIEHIGFYRIAQSWMWAVIYMVPIASQVLYPYFSGSDDKKKINSIFSNSLRYSSIFVFPLAFLLCAFSDNLILFFYKESYLPVVQPLIILSLSTILVMISMLLTSFFNGIEKPGIITKLNIFTLLIYLPASYILTSIYGILGTACALLFIKLVETLFLALIATKRYQITFNKSDIIKPLLCSASMYIFSIVLFSRVSLGINFILFSMISLGIYIIFMLISGGIKRSDIDIFFKHIKI
jgi:O-antigen/teichoic acid export membrane protein